MLLVYPKTIAAKSAKCPRVSAWLTVDSERCYCERMLNAPAWEIGRALGIPIRVHPSWFLVFLFVTWSLATGYLPDALPGLSNSRYWGMGAVAAVLLFVSVLLHELGHSYVAQRYRIPIGQITLFLFGGVAQMRAEPPSPKAEFLIAIAGPVVSFALGAFSLGIAAASEWWPVPSGQGFAVIGGLFDPSTASNGGWLMFIGAFLVGAAWSTRKQVTLRIALSGTSVRDVMV